VGLRTINVPRSPYTKLTYYEDMVISAFDSPFRRKCAVFGLLILLIFPFVGGNYLMHLANLIAIASIGALALNLVCGNAGQISLGHAGFMASGAFTTAIMSVNFGMPVWVVLPTVALVGAIIGLIAGLPALRLKGIYLGLSTLGVYYILKYLCREYQFYGGFSYGIPIKDPQIGPFAISNDRVWFFVLCSLVWMVALFIKNLLRSRIGRAWIAIQNRDIAAELGGINIGYYKVLSFVVSTSITAIAGSLYVYYTNVADIETFTFMLTISYIAMIIVGGLGSVLGSLMGAFLITILPYFIIYFFELFEVSGVHLFPIQSGFFGIVIIFFLLVEPSGLVEIWRRIRDYFQLWPFKYRPLAVTKR
jgi:branched-chain amino acid transport system permease protein